MPRLPNAAQCCDPPNPSHQIPNPKQIPRPKRLKIANGYTAGCYNRAERSTVHRFGLGVRWPWGALAAGWSVSAAGRNPYPSSQPHPSTRRIRKPRTRTSTTPYSALLAPRRFPTTSAFASKKLVHRGYAGHRQAIPQTHRKKQSQRGIARAVSDGKVHSASTLTDPIRCASAQAPSHWR